MEHFLADLITAQRRQNFDARALVHSHRRDLPPVPSFIERVPSMGQWLYTPMSPTFPYRLRKLIRQFKPEILQLHLPNPSAFWVLFSRACRAIPWVVHWHSDVVIPEKSHTMEIVYRPYQQFEKRLLRRAHKIIATSPNYRDFSPQLRPHLAKCEVIPLGIDPSRLLIASSEQTQFAEQCWQNPGLRLLVVGRLSHYKGHEVLLHALTHCEGMQLICVGEGECRWDLLTNITTHGLQDRVKLLGFCDDGLTAALMATCDVLVLPSVARSEAFGMVLLEAMIWGKPVVASEIEGSGTAFVVEQGQHGLTFPAGNAGALAQALQRLQSSELRQQLGEQGRAALPRQFHIDAVVEQLRELYPRVLSPAQI